MQGLQIKKKLRFL